MQREAMIDLKTHTQLSTVLKIFSGASTAFGAAPNTQAASVDLALPNVLPMLNKDAIERAIVFGLAIGAKIAPKSIFARRNYFYPDLPKGYQISQYEIPVMQGGTLTFQVEGKNGQPGYEKTAQLMCAHLEEDVDKSLHEDFAGMTGIDLNRAGMPLLEIVIEPDMHSAAEAVAYAKALHALVMWLGTCDGNMQEGSFRCDANVSVRQDPDAPFGTRCEIKNLNSFRFLEEAINYEVRRQVELIEDDGIVVQETCLYDSDYKETRSVRSKEDTQDYRYFPDPDLLPLVTDDDWIERVRVTLPELSAAIAARSEPAYGLPKYDASILTATKATAAYSEVVVADAGTTNAKAAANWIVGEVASSLNRADLDIDTVLVSLAQLTKLLVRIADGTISDNTAKKDVFPAMRAGEHGGDADTIIAEKGLKQMSDSGELEKIIDDVLAVSARSVEEFHADKEKAFNALVGQVMKATRSKANPAQVNDLLKKKLGVA